MKAHPADRAPARTPIGAPVLRGLVLAGGRSLRMGADKAGLQVAGRTLLARSVGLLQPLTASVEVAVRPDQADEAVRQHFSLLFDAVPDAGPAGGLLAAWQADPAAAWLVIACDMPELTPDDLAALVAARDAARGGTAWRNSADGGPEPLCAIWEPATLAQLAAAIQTTVGNATSPRAVLQAADPLLLNPHRASALSSVNTPAELHRFLEAQHGPSR